MRTSTRIALLALAGIVGLFAIVGSIVIAIQPDGRTPAKPIASAAAVAAPSTTIPTTTPPSTPVATPSPTHTTNPPTTDTFAPATYGPAVRSLADRALPELGYNPVKTPKGTVWKRPGQISGSPEFHWTGKTGPLVATIPDSGFSCYVSAMIDPAGDRIVGQLNGGMILIGLKPTTWPSLGLYPHSTAKHPATTATQPATVNLSIPAVGGGYTIATVYQCWFAGAPAK
jgi:hypothetical protein